VKRALITGITGQDGAYLTEWLLGQGYEVHGLIRRSSSFNTGRIDHLINSGRTDLRLHFADMSDATSLRRALELVQPDEVYHLAAQSHVRVSFDIPEYTADIVGLGTLRLLEALRDHIHHSARPVRFYQAGSSEMFGSAPPPQDEATPFHPRSPYAVSKVAAHWYGINYREAYGMFICNGILFNHESPRRGETFVTRKITRALARILAGRQNKVYLGNLDAQRDWGFAGDYVEAMWLMLQQDQPDDYVIATGETHSVRDFLATAFGAVGRDWQQFVEIDRRYFRPSEVDCLCGDASKARTRLGWAPKVSFTGLVQMMVEADLASEGLVPSDWLVA
jgi:GDPmannose 4,6-dehydratase